MAELSGQGMQATAMRDTIIGVAGDLEQNIQRLSKLYDAMRHVGDRIDGARPEPIGTQAGADTPPSSVILDMRRKHTAMSSLIGKCEDEIQRLALALGISSRAHSTSMSGNAR